MKREIIGGREGMTDNWFITPDIDGGTIDNVTIGATTPAAISGTTGTFNGILQGGLDVITASANTTLTADQCRGSLVLVSTTCTITLPAVSGVIEGGHLTIYSTGTNLIKLDLDSVDRFILDGTALVDDHMLDSESGAGDYVTVVKDSAAGWTVIGRSGAWTDGDTS